MCRKSVHGVVCDQLQQQSFLVLGKCMTYNDSCSDEQESNAISFGGCPYLYYSNISRHRYRALPHNVSDLNDFFCAPLNREGLLCRDCIDGFGPSIISIGYACANCTENYGWILYILSEFVPVTVFYFVVLTLRIRITSAPMNCFVMFSQFMVISLKKSPEFQGILMAELSTTSRAMFKVILTGYGFWNLDFFRYFIPPFCVSQSLKNIHVLALQYVSAFYPLLLIALTYTCIELHGHNFRPIVWLWKPFRKCCVNVRRRWDTKASLIDVFATFLLLSYSKLLFVSLFLLEGTKIYNADGELAPGTLYVLLVDATVRFLSKEHFPYATAAFFILVLTLLPPLLLILYPCKLFSRCFSCCSDRRKHALRIFVEAFQGCYKTEGCDFRSMSAVYLLLRFALFFANPIHLLAWPLRVLMFLTLSTLILIVRPYRKCYMNVLDALLLALLAFLILIVVTLNYVLPSSDETLPLIFVIACGLPQVVLLLSVIYRQLKGKRISQYIAGKVGTLLKKFHKKNRAEDDRSDPLPDRLVNPDQYNQSLLSESEQAPANSETLTVAGQLTPVYTYGSIS